MRGLGFRVCGSAFMVQVLAVSDQADAHWVHCAGCRVQGSGSRVKGAGCRVQGAGCRVQGAGFRV